MRFHQLDQMCSQLFDHAGHHCFENQCFKSEIGVYLDGIMGLPS